MLNRVGTILLLIILIHTDCFGQDTDPGAGYQMILINNPALSGSEGDGKLELSYLNFYPGNNYNLHSVYLSYDSYFTALHGGAGFYLTDDYMGGIINDLRGGLSYSYFLKAGRKLYIHAGLSGSVYHRGFNFTRAVLPEQIDPLGGEINPASETLANSGRTVVDIGAGFLFISGKIFGGFSINHLSEPDLSLPGYSNENLKRKILMHLMGDFDLNKVKNLKIRPIVYLGFQSDYYWGGAGVVLESEYLSVNSVLLSDNSGTINNQSGFTLKIGNLLLYYNYRFNIISGNDMMPLSLLHQTGLSFTLTTVDKRNAIKTINFPKL
jgi:type IX secretion system PorP/SprF family membrane protein